MRGETVIFLPDDGYEDEYGYVEGGSVEEVGQAEQCQYDKHELGCYFHHLLYVYLIFINDLLLRY